MRDRIGLSSRMASLTLSIVSHARWLQASAGSPAVPEGICLGVGLGLDASAEQAAGGDSGIDERPVVGVAIEVDRCPGQTLGLEVRGEQGGERIRAGSRAALGVDEPNRVR